MVDRFEKFTISIFEITRYWHRLATEEMAKYGLKGPQAIYLTTLYRFSDGITAQKLSQMSGKDKADVSRMLSILEEKGLVTKQGVGKNMYRAIIKLTDKGKEAAQKVSKRIALTVDMAGKGLKEKDREAFYNALELISSNLRSLSESGLPT